MSASNSPTRWPSFARARRDGERRSKFFADARHGGSDGALAQAVAFRDRLLASIPAAPTKPRRAWSNTGVVGLSVREKGEGDKARLNVHLNWMDADGRRRAGSFSVEKWGLRRALWNGCLKLYRERKTAGYPVEEPHEMFARAQEPFQDLIRAEIDAQQATEREASRARAKAERDERNRQRFEAEHAPPTDADAVMSRLQEVLFG